MFLLKKNNYNVAEEQRTLIEKLGIPMGVRPSWVLNSRNGNLENQPGVDFTRNTKRHYWVNGLLKTAPVHELPVSYNPVTGRPEGWPIMGQWTNEMFDWSDFSQSSWTKENSVTVGTDIGIKGTTENIKLTPDGTNNGRIRQDKTVSDNSNTHTVQAWLKKNMSAAAKVEAVLSGGTTGVTADVVVDTSDGSVVSGSATVTDNGDFWEIEFQITNNSSGNTTLSKRYYPDNTNQTSAQTFDIPSLFKNRSYTPPTPVYGTVAGQSYTQDPDIPVVNDLDSIDFNPDEGTFVGEFILSNPKNNNILYVKNGTSDRMLAKAKSNGNVNVIIDKGGVNQVNLSKTAAITANTRFKVAISYSDTSVKVAVNGSVNELSTSHDIPKNLVELNLFADDAAVNPLEGFNGFYHYYPRQLSDAQHIQESTL